MGALIDFDSNLSVASAALKFDPGRTISYLREVCTSYKQTIYFCDDFKENVETMSVCKQWKLCDAAGTVGNL